MSRNKIKFSVALVAVFTVIGAVSAHGDPPQPPRVLPGRGPAILGRGAPAGAEKDKFTVLNQAELVFVAKVANVQYGPVAQSLPPIYTLTITFEKGEFLKGAAPEKLTFGYQKRQLEKPTFELGKSMLVAASRAADKRVAQLQIALIVPADKDVLKTAKAAAALPLGWKMDGDQSVSPWAKLGKDAWPKDAEVTSMLRCSKSDRPGLLVGPGIELTVDQVIPKEVVKFQNPYGDGEFKITLTNITDKKIEIPALLTDGKEILWGNSLIIINRDATLLLPTAKKLTAVQSVAVDPGESVSGVINLLPLEGVAWPRGGSRVQFQFCLGELSAPNFFYYFSRRHDKLRDEAIAASKSE